MIANISRLQSVRRLFGMEFRFVTRVPKYLIKCLVTFSLYGEELSAFFPIPKLGNHLLSAVRDCLISILAATLHTWKPFFHPQVSIRQRRYSTRLKSTYREVTAVIPSRPGLTHDRLACKTCEFVQMSPRRFNEIRYAVPQSACT